MRKLAAATPSDGVGPLDTEAVSALVNLGYRAPEAERAVRAVSAAGAGDLAEIIRHALRKLSG
jgi:Holliday junction resolvasome RuvABC DNA-binding subunit